MLRWYSMWVALLQPVRAENLSGGQDPLVTFFRETSVTAKVVLGVLLLFSLISWIIIFAKYLRLAKSPPNPARFLPFSPKPSRFPRSTRSAASSGTPP